MLNEIEKYRFKIRIYLTILGAMAALGFSIFQYINESYQDSFLSMMCAFHFSAVVYLLIKEQRYLWEGRGYAIVLSFTLLSITEAHPEYGIFWAYVMITYIFLLMKSKEALFVSIIYVSFSLYFIDSYYSAPILTRIYATLMLVSLFGFLFSFLMEQLLLKVDRLITHDPLTNALNRHTFHTSVENALSSFIRYKTPASLFIFDLDKFKNINDTYGHQVGDNVLKQVSHAIIQRLRDCDQLFRYGGEEFAVLLTQTTQDDAIQLAEDLRHIIEKQDNKLNRKVTISGGVSQVLESDQVNSWIERCDKALYRAKATGRNKVILG